MISRKIDFSHPHFDTHFAAIVYASGEGVLTTHLSIRTKDGKVKDFLIMLLNKLLNIIKKQGFSRTDVKGALKSAEKAILTHARLFDRHHPHNVANMQALLMRTIHLSSPNQKQLEKLRSILVRCQLPLAEVAEQLTTNLSWLDEYPKNFVEKNKQEIELGHIIQYSDEKSFKTLVSSIVNYVGKCGSSDLIELFIQHLNAKISQANKDEILDKLFTAIMDSKDGKAFESFFQTLVNLPGFGKMTMSDFVWERLAQQEFEMTDQNFLRVILRNLQPIYFVSTCQTTGLIVYLKARSKKNLEGIDPVFLEALARKYPPLMNPKDYQGDVFPLFKAVELDQFSAFVALIEKGANVHVEKREELGSLKLIQFCLEHRKDRFVEYLLKFDKSLWMETGVISAEERETITLAELLERIRSSS